MRSGWIKLLLVLAAVGLLALIVIFKFDDFRGNKEIQAKRITFRGHTFDWIKLDPSKVDLKLFWMDAEGNPYSNFTNLKTSLEQQGKNLVFATNAGIFSSDVTPGGLHVEEGAELHKLNLRDGEGNFHMKPNGVFFIEDRTAYVMESTSYTLNRHNPWIASQSGPMLVIDGKLHPAFTEGSDNRNIRNGVGVDRKGYVHFAISNERVNFHDFASLFLDALKCPNALYLDGSISDFYLPVLDRTPTGSGYCGIFGVVEPSH